MSNVCVKNCCIGSGIPKICVPIVATNLREIFSQARGMQRKNFDLIEWRIGAALRISMTSTWFAAPPASCTGILDDQPFILTFRTIGEGGNASRLNRNTTLSCTAPPSRSIWST